MTAAGRGRNAGEQAAHPGHHHSARHRTEDGSPGSAQSSHDTGLDQHRRGHLPPVRRLRVAAQAHTAVGRRACAGCWRPATPRRGARRLPRRRGSTRPRRSDGRRGGVTLRGRRRSQHRRVLADHGADLLAERLRGDALARRRRSRRSRHRRAGRWRWRCRTAPVRRWPGRRAGRTRRCPRPSPHAAGPVAAPVPDRLTRHRPRSRRRHRRRCTRGAGSIVLIDHA